MNMEILGKRLKTVREFHNLTQIQVAEIVHCPRIKITRLEAGTDVKSQVMADCLAYYSQFIQLNILFDDRFDLLISDERVFTKKTHLESVVSEKLVDLKIDLLSLMETASTQIRDKMEAIESLSKSISTTDTNSTE